MQKLESWVNTHVKEFNKQKIDEMSNMLFFREEHRPSINDERVFMAPADGIVIGVAKVDINDETSLINAKGVEYSLKDMLANKRYYIQKIQALGGKALVVDIFMTYYDIHSNRTPYECYQMGFEQVQPLKTLNFPMIKTEEALFEGKLDEALGYTGKYLKNNQRAITEFWNSDLGIPFFTVQLADDVVDCITNFFAHKPTQRIRQSIKYGAIRYGSGCSLIVPITDNFDVEPIISVGDHVEGGVDAVMKISKLNGKVVNEDIDHTYNEEITDDTYESYFDALKDVSFNDMLEEEELYV